MALGPELAVFVRAYRDVSSWWPHTHIKVCVVEPVLGRGGGNDHVTANGRRQEGGWLQLLVLQLYSTAVQLSVSMCARHVLYCTNTVRLY